MPWTEDDENEARQLDAEERHERDVGQHEPDEPCSECGASDWELTGRDVYGADADGRRGAPMYVFNCRDCGAEMEVVHG